MKRKEIVKELNREVETRQKVYPRWIQIKKLNKEVARRRLDQMTLASLIFEVMTDDEFTALCDRLLITEPSKQFDLFTPHK